MDRSVGSPWTRSVVGVRRPGVSVFGLPKIIHNLNEGQQINTNFRFMGNGIRYLHTHYPISFIANNIHVFSHLRLKSAIPQDFKTSTTAVTCAHNQ